MIRLLISVLLLQLSLSAFAGDDIIRRWEFEINTQDGVSCTYDSESNKLLLSGFEASDDSLFYFAGGTPLRLVCFDGTMKVFSRTIGDMKSASAFLKLRGDSIYLLNNETVSLLRVHKTGMGPVDRLPLMISESHPSTETAFVPTDCYMSDDDVVLLRQRNTITVNDTYVFPGYDVIHVGYDGRFVKWKWVGDNESTIGNCYFNNDILNQYLYPSKKLKLKDFVGLYKGDWNGYGIYWGETLHADKASWTVAFTNKDNDVIDSYHISYHVDDKYAVIPLPVLTHRIDDETAYTSPSYCILRGRYLYMVGYQGERGRIIVCRIDLQKIKEES